MKPSIYILMNINTIWKNSNKGGPKFNEGLLRWRQVNRLYAWMMKIIIIIFIYMNSYGLLM